MFDIRTKQRVILQSNYNNKDGGDDDDRNVLRSLV